jgi:C-terminal processing protease CtpA/Prc
VIHSTKDGPAVHTVKEGSSLEGHIFPGDLIISVDNVDTRSYTAEQVMKMMASKSDRERKITVLHFEEED